MDRKVRVVSVLLVLGVALALAGPAAGDMRAAFAGAGAGTAAASYSLDAAMRQLIPANRLEDGVAPELTVDVEVHRRVLAGNVGNAALNKNKQICIRSCSRPGGPYTGPSCLAVYLCRGGH